MIKNERAQQTSSVTHEQRGKYDFFLPSKRKEKILNSNTNTIFTPCPKISLRSPTPNPKEIRLAYKIRTSDT